MKTLHIKNKKGDEFSVLIDDEYWPILSKIKWVVTKSGYPVFWMRKEKGYHIVFLHHFIVGKPIDNLAYVVDHVNRNTLDNTKKNLRICTRAENIRNSKIDKTNTSGFKGVSKANVKIHGNRKRCWRADIKFDGNRKFLGWYDTPQKAHEAYKEAAQKYHGVFACF